MRMRNRMKLTIAALTAAAVCTVTVVPAAAQNLAGGWAATEDITVTEEAQQAFDAAVETEEEALTGLELEAVALLGTQVVSGTNYCILCRGRSAGKELRQDPFYAVLYIYQDLEGNAKILDADDLDMGIDEDRDDREETDELGWEDIDDPDSVDDLDDLDYPDDIEDFDDYEDYDG